MSSKLFRHDDYEEDWQRSQRRKERDNARRQKRIVVDDWVDPKRLAAMQAVAEAEEKVEEPVTERPACVPVVKRSSITESTASSGPASAFAHNIPEPNETTHVIKGNQINFDRVIDVVKVENEHEGKHTFGIKFVFRGSSEKRELARIAWFNINQKERDRVFVAETNFWHSLQQQ